ncbi:carbapenem biosynthesis protein CpmH [Pectobacteriaceae bacterium CE70]|nr:carbapenem biosynthesis protein CpmH [Pectobacteriaceae bacterium C52]WJV65675.1 carbapenem biosynthesis protein CpmH [Pectobacteriaceae bacterium CE70]WJY09697.1 carbapenem biosynthesis protein CpmH [Pectobacteriaceae bacterium C80]
MKIYSLMLLMSLFSVDALAKNDSNTYRQLLQDFFGAEPPLCLGERAWPVNSHTHDSPWVSGRLNALVDARLARKTQEGKKIIYNLTPLGEKNWRKYGDLCYGRMHVTRIEKVDHINRELTVVYFYYRLEPLERWARNRSLRFAFSELDNLVNGMDKIRYIATIRETLGGAAKLQDYPTPVELDY